MASYFNTGELSTALTNLSSLVSEKAATAQLYPLLKKATSSSEEPCPGWVSTVLYCPHYRTLYRCTQLWWSLPGAAPSSAATWCTTSTPGYRSGLCWVKSALQH